MQHERVRAFFLSVFLLLGVATDLYSIHKVFNSFSIWFIIVPSGRQWVRRVIQMSSQSFGRNKQQKKKETKTTLKQKQKKKTTKNYHLKLKKAMLHI